MSDLIKTNEQNEQSAPIEQDLRDLIRKEISGEAVEEVAEDAAEPVVNPNVFKKEDKTTVAANNVPEGDPIIGQEDQVQLRTSDLMKDSYTPGESMKHLDALVERQKAEVEQAREIYEKRKQQDEVVKAVKAREENKKAAFNDEVITEDEIAKEKPEEEITVTRKPKNDLSRLKIVKPKDENKVFMDYMERRKKSSATTSVPLPNSGYTASLRGLSSPEIRDVSVSLNSKDQFGSWDYLYKTIYDRLIETSIGEIDYVTFLKSTALSELQTLLYGLFDATYPEVNSYPARCPKCNTKFDFQFPNKKFLHIDEEDKYSASKDIRALIAGQAIDAKEFFKNSNTNTVVREELEDSGIIVDLRHPTLYNQLYDVIRQLVDNRIDTENVSDVTLDRMPYIEAVYIPVDGDPKNGYYPLEDLMTKVNVLAQLDPHDDAQLELAISEEILDKYKIYYKIDSVKCPLCGETVEGGDVDFRSMLFMMQRIKSDIKRK